MAQGSERKASHYRELLWHSLVRQTLLYFLPLLLLAIFFHIQYRRVIDEGKRGHLAVIAEHQANTLDLFLRERLVNLANTIDEPQFKTKLTDATALREALARLRQTSDAFVDLGVVDETGALVSYQGPVRFPSSISYGEEEWFRGLMRRGDDWVITDIYLGIRGQPHFTIAVKRDWGGDTHVLRSALSPDKISEYLATLEGASEVRAAVVNAEGVYQVVTARVGSPLGESPFLPPRQPRRGHVDDEDPRGSSDYAYAWLEETPWALVVTDAGGAASRGAFAGLPSNVLLATVGFFVLMGVVILLRARQLVGKQLAVEEHEQELSGQLVQAAKLASVGELAAGIAHEINNPLAIIAEEVGLLKDMHDPELAEEGEEVNLVQHLDTIHEAVFRCRDITRKLLTFVRQTEVKLDSHHIHEILDEVIDGMLGNELALANVAVVRGYDPRVPRILTDRNQLIQVFVNLVKNADDAMNGGGTLFVRTKHLGDRVVVAIEDTGCGMTPEQLEKVFVPFFTTKEPGKGTGLGLSVSFTIIKNFGGEMYVESKRGQGSTFSVELPYEIRG